MNIVLITLVLIICSYYFTRLIETEDTGVQEKRIKMTDEELFSMDGFGTGWIVQFKDGYFLGKIKEGELVTYGNKTQFDYFAYKFHKKTKALGVAKKYEGAIVVRYD